MRKQRRGGGVRSRKQAVLPLAEGSWPVVEFNLVSAA